MNAIGLGYSAHFKGIVHISSPVIQARKDMAMQINHD
jgi:hypothetical protein